MRPAAAILSLVVAILAIVLTIGAAVAILANPIWIFPAQDRAGADRLTGYTSAEVRVASGAILVDLLLGPPDFDVAIRGEPVLTERERAHMRDVRGTFLGLAAAVLASALGLLAIRRVTGRPDIVWRGVRWAGTIAALAVVALAGFALVAFDTLFDLVVHRLFFAVGTYTFDPRTDRLVQLFPEPFWFETALAFGAVVIVLGLLLRSWASRRLRAAASARATVVALLPEAAPEATAEAAPSAAPEAAP